jgi:insertion element IS1 protein InsB
MYKCTKCVDNSVERSSSGYSVCRYGKSAGGKQRYKCKLCRRTFIATYSNRSWNIHSGSIVALLKEGCGIRSIGRLLQISKTTVQQRIIRIAKLIKKPPVCFYKTYEVDEMCTYYRSKGRQLWIVYALQRDTKTVSDFSVGSRTKATLQKVISTLVLSHAQEIYTDRLTIYKLLVPSYLHNTGWHGTNHIERKNLDLRTHLKRLNRRTICFSKSIAMLCACLKIYFWGECFGRE